MDTAGNEVAPATNLRPIDATVARVFNYFGKICAPDEETAKAQGAPYYAVRVVGQGAMGVVMHVKRTGTGADFALKAVDLEGLSESDRSRAMTEVHLLLSCDFFSIIKCYEDHLRSGPDGEPLFVLLIMDYANAGDLRQEIRCRARDNRPFREHEAGLLFLQLLMAVHHVHNNHMIHRDIKSANIFLCCSGIIKLGDFGLSKSYNESVSENVGRTFCGTPYYVAPEIWNRLPYSKKADMFSLGVLLYELLTLKRPFNGGSVQEVMERVLQGAYEPLPDTITEEMRSMVGDLLRPEPQERPNTKQLLSRPICKLFIDGLVGIVQSQSAFDSTREIVKENIQRTRDSLHRSQRSRPTDADGDIEQASTMESQGSIRQSPLEQLDPNHIFCEGTVRKLSSDGTWKKRYVCIYCREPLSEATTMSQFDMLLAVSRRSIQQQCILTPFSEFEDVFPVPPKYSGSQQGFVFAIAFKSGVKRVTFQTATEEDRRIWMRKFQQAIGIDTDA